MDFHWDGAAPEFSLAGEGGPSLALKLDADRPGLLGRDGAGRAVCRLLALEALASLGRCDRAAFAPSNLVEAVRVRDRVEATYVPAGWNGLRVRAAWSPVRFEGHLGIDLEVQAQAATAEIVPAVEVLARSEWSIDAPGQSPPLAVFVGPRDARAAAMSYDGRETLETLRRLHIEPVPWSSRPEDRPAMPLPVEMDPALFPPEVASEIGYIEMVHPDDCARQMRQVADFIRARSPAERGWVMRYGLFGHDLEKGVVMRARLRGLWLPRAAFADGASAARAAFLSEPLPLGP